MCTLARTYSNPNLKDRNYKWETQKYNYPHEEDEFYVIGDRVYVDGYRPASVAYFGEVEFASGDYVGVVLDSQTGEHTGKVHGREYFQCAPFHGLFVRPFRVSRVPDSTYNSSANSSQFSTPVPNFQRPCEVRNFKSPSSSTADSYFYDDDYRTPSTSSLEQRIKNIQQMSSSANRSAQTKIRDLGNQVPVRSGILKNTNYTRPDSALSRKIEELSRSISASPSQSNIAFNFRPQRVPLEDSTRIKHYDLDDSTQSRYRNNSRIEFMSECRKGDRVVVLIEKRDKELNGILRYLGETSFASGEWAGVELDFPEGKNDGSVLGRRYFYCTKNHGLFVPATRVRKAELSREEFKTMRSTIKSPPPLTYRNNSSSLFLDSESPTTSEATSRETHSSVSDVMSPVNNKSYLNLVGTLPRAHQCVLETSLDPWTPKDIFSDNQLDSNHRSSNSKPPLFSEADIELQLKKSLQKPSIQQSRVTESNIEPVRTKSVKYTFASSKYDGNPIVRRTVEYI